jgi:hypothetical protein
MTTDTAPKIKIIDCPNCGAAIPLRALGQSVMTVCASCGTRLDTSRPEIRVIKAFRLQQQQLHIPLGKRGTLRGRLFEVIGALRRGEQDGMWEEYLLFNPYIGFRWLVYDTGHWSFGRMVRDPSSITTAAGLMHYGGRYFRLYHRGTPQIRWVVGEFYWRVAVGQEVDATDYVCPPMILSCEKSAGEIIWTLLEYLEPVEVETAFQITSPERQWLAANQPNPAVRKWEAIKPVMWAALAALVVAQIGTAIRARTTTMAVGTYDLSHAQGEAQAYGPFTFSASGSMNELLATAPLDNSWVELQCSLVNTVTGKSYDFTNSFSYYHGIDSDGGWSEGSTSDISTLANVPAGTYKLIVAAGGQDKTGHPPSTPVSLSLRHDVVPWQNFWIGVLVILTYPGYLLYRRYGYERERWSEANPT